MIAAAAVVLEVTGFQATVIRSVVTAINLASGSSFPNKVFASLSPACVWLSTQVGPMLDPHSLERRVRALDAGPSLDWNDSPQKPIRTP